MRAAPAVSLELSPGQALRLLIAGLHGLAASAIGWWGSTWVQRLLGADEAVTWPGFAHSAMPWLAAMAGCAWGSRAAGRLFARQQCLVWTGRDWALTNQAGAVAAGDGVQALRRLTVAIDLDVWVLLRWTLPDGTHGWGHASRAHARRAGELVSWHLMRVAWMNHSECKDASAELM